MIETAIFNYLKANLTDVDVLMKLEDEVPDMFVFFERVGSTTNNKLEHPSFAFQSYAPTLLETIELNGIVKDLINAMPETEDSVMGVKCTTDYNFPDLTRKRERYQAVFDFYL